MEIHGVWLILLGVGMTALGTWPLAISVRHIGMGRRSHAWPTAPGRVTASRIVRGRYWSFDVGYRYDVADISYEGEMLQAGQPTGSRAQAEALEQQYAVGTEVTVHYDPARPDRAVLVPGVGSGAFWGVVGAAMLMVIGVLILRAEVGRQVHRSPSSPQVELPFTALNDPMGVAVEGDGTVYVCDGVPAASPSAQVPGWPSPTAPVPGLPAPGLPAPAAGRVLALPPDSGGSRELLRQLFEGPTGVAVDSSGRIYVTDTKPGSYWGRLWVFTINQTPDSPGRTEITGTQPLSSLLSPGGVAVNSAGTVYVVQRLSGTVLQLPAGDTTATVFFKAPEDGTATDVAVDSADNVYVTDYRKNLVLKLAVGGAAPTPLPFAGLLHPQGVAVDTAGNVYVADAGNHRVLKLAAGSNTQTELPFAGLKDPYDVAVDTAGSVYVTDQGNRRVLKMPPQ